MANEGQPKLVLVLRPGEAVVADGVRITVDHISPGRVRLLFEAPREIEIQRVREGQR